MKKALIAALVFLMICCPFSVLAESVRINDGSYPNVRSEPSTAGSIIGNAKSNQVYDLLSTSGSWYKIRLEDGKEGWIANGMATVITSHATANAYQQTYIAMLEEFDRGNYADAYIAAEIVYEADAEYQEIVNYYHYLTALQVYLPEGRYEEAFHTFQALALRQFQKSEGYAAYALGCQYMNDGNNDAALKQFKAAFTNGIDAAYQKIQDCEKNQSPEPQPLEITYSANGFAVTEIKARLLDRTYIDIFQGEDDAARRRTYYETVFNVPEGDTKYDLFAAPADLRSIPVSALGSSELVLCLRYTQFADSAEAVEGKLILEGLPSGTVEKAFSLQELHKTGLIFIGADELVPDLSLWRAGSCRLILMLNGQAAYACNIALVP